MSTLLRRSRELLQCSILYIFVAAAVHAQPAPPPTPSLPEGPEGAEGAEGPDGRRAAFEAALELLGRDDAGAAARLESVAAAHPTGHDEYTADALAEAAALYEEKLGRPDRARALYAQLLARDPGSRLALRARARLAFLDESLTTGVAPLAAYQNILYGFSTRPTAASARLMEALVAAYPDFVLAEKALLWLAALDLREGRVAEAARRYLAVEHRYPGGEAWALARKGRAECALEAGHPLDARRLYQSILDAPPAVRATLESAARAGRERAATALRRLVACYLALACVAAYIAWQLRAARPLFGSRAQPRALPIELLYYLPVAALFVVAAARENRPIAMATLLIAGGGAVVVLVSALATERRLARGPLGMGARVGGALGLALAGGALVFLAVHTTRLTDVVVETMRNGPDR